SKSVQFSLLIFSTSSSPPKMSAPACSASRTLSPLAITRTFFDLPSPCGRTTVPRTIWSACLGSTPSRMVTSTVSSNLANFTFCSSGTASSSRYGRFSTAARAFSMFLPVRFAIGLLVSYRLRIALQRRSACDSPASKPGSTLCRNINSHGTRRALHGLNGGFQRGGVQVRHLLAGDLFHLLFRDLPDLVLVGRTRTLGDPGGALQQHRGRRSLGHKGEAAVVVNRDHHRDDEPFQFLGAGARVELLAELHDVDLRLTQRRSYRRRRRRLPGGNLQLDGSCDLFCHFLALGF